MTEHEPHPGLSHLPPPPASEPSPPAAVGGESTTTSRGGRSRRLGRKAPSRLTSRQPFPEFALESASTPPASDHPVKARPGDLAPPPAQSEPRDGAPSTKAGAAEIALEENPEAMAPESPEEAPMKAARPDTPGLNRKIPRKVSKFLDKRGGLFDDEIVEAAVGGTSHALICTDQRLLVVKVGITAGATGGGRLTAFHFQDVTALQRQLGIYLGTLAVQSPGYGATQVRDVWSIRRENAMELPNVIPWSKLENAQYADEIAHIERRIQEARRGPSQSNHQDGGDLKDPTEQLERLAVLHQDGMLDDEEYAAGKRKVLGFD